MVFSRELDQFIRWFYICGLSCYPSFDGFSFGKTKNNRLLNYIPIGGLVAFSVILSISVYIYQILHDSNVHTQMNIWFMFFTLLTPTITVIMCATQMIYQLPHFGEICSLLCAVERLTWQKFSFDSKTFKRQFLLKISLMSFAYIMPILFTVCFNQWLISYFGVLTLKAIVLLMLIQAFFYVELLDHMLKCLNRHIDGQVTNTAMAATLQTITAPNPTADQLKIKLVQFKLVHFHLWSISQKINELFGWIIVAIVLQNFAYAIFNVAWTFAMIYLNGFLTDILRKSTTPSDNFQPLGVLTLPSI